MNNINAELLKILKTKNSKPLTDAQNKLLISLGYIVIVENEERSWSAYNYYRLINTTNGRTIVISKDRENKKGLFDPYSKIECKNMELMDIVNFLNTNESERNQGDTINENYRRFKQLKQDLDYHNRQLSEIERQIEKLNEDKIHHTKKIKNIKQMIKVINP